MLAKAEEVLAVHEELLTLIRAGLPLDRGLRDLAQDLPGKMRPLVSELHQRLQRGEDVTQAVATLPSPGARAYAAVLAAGMRSGRPAQALEGVVSTARRALDFRKALSAELVYPLLVLIVGINLIAFSLTNLAPINVMANEAFGAGGPLTHSLAHVDMMTRPAWILIPLVTAMGIVLFLLVPRWAGASPLSASEWWRPFRQMRIWQSTALFCDLLALLIEHDTPLPESLQLAAEATPYRPLKRSVEDLGQRIAKGETGIKAACPLTPTVSWLLQRPAATSLPEALRREAEHARRRVDRLQRWFSIYFPASTTFMIGVVCIAILALINLAPLVNLYYHLSRGGW